MKVLGLDKRVIWFSAGAVFMGLCSFAPILFRLEVRILAGDPVMLNLLHSKKYRLARDEELYALETVSPSRGE